VEVAVVSAVDAPPGVALADLPSGQFASRPRPHRRARRIFGYVSVTSALTLVAASRRLHAPVVEILFIAALIAVTIAALGLAVRRARVRIDADGVRWGWELGGVRLHRHRLRSVTTYRDAIALQPRRGSTWFLCRRDWDRFDDIPDALADAGVDVEVRRDQVAPFAARMQSYGLVLDVLLVIGAAMSSAVLLAAAAIATGA
jgi:hypothetical protein